MKAFFHPFTQITLTSLLVSLGFLTALPSYAEGSRDLTAPGTPGFRAFLEDFNGLTAGITRRNEFKVFVNNGETLYLGSSAQGISSGGIQYIPPSGGAGTLCPATQGRILNRTQELAGPYDPTNAGTNSNGYTPCKVNVTQTGIWTIKFLSPNPDGGDPGIPASGLNTLATADWAIGGPNNIQQSNRGVAAWDITVFNGTTERKGRAFANYLPLNTGANSRGVGSDFYVLTDDGYRYTLDLNGLDPFGFILFANNKGFKNNSTNNSLYRSINLSNGNLPTGVSVHFPTAADTATETTHKIFFNSPDSAMPATATIPGGNTWLYTDPGAGFPSISGFQFQGVEDNTPGKAGTFPLGGNFLFNASQKGIYNIILDLNQNGTFGDGNDRLLVGNAVNGANTVLWDGKDANDVTVNPSNIAYNAQISLNVGEVHFPILDPENNPQGIIVTRTNGGGAPNSTIYYNDTGLTGGTAPVPINAFVLGGVNSAGGAHRFSSNFGNEKGINTWANLPSAPATFNNIQIQAADLKITKTDGLTTVAPGSSVSYIIDVTNFNNPPTSVSNVQGIEVTDTFPPQITNVTLGSCQITTGVGTCVSSNITGNALNATLDLNSGATARIIVTGIVAANVTNGTVITNTARVDRQLDVTDPVDDDSSGGTNLFETAVDTTTVVTAPPPLLNKSVRFPADGDLNSNGTLEIGEIVEYTITVRNSSSTQPVTGLVIADAIPSQLEVQDGTVAINNPTNALQPATLASSLPTGNFDGTGNPVTLTQPGTLAAGGSFTITYRAKIKPGSANPIFNQARANYTGDGGNPILSDASGSTNPTQPGTGNNPGFPNQTGNVDQITGGPNDPTQLYFAPPVTPAGSKSVRLVTDVDNSGSVTQGDVLEYTVIYFNSNNVAVTDFLATDVLNASQLEFVPGSYSFVASPGTTVTANSNYNGTTDQNLTNSVTKGNLAANGGRVTIKFRTRILASAGATIANQAVATSTGGTLNSSITDAAAGPGDIPQVLNDGVNTGNLEDSGDDEPTLVQVVGAGNARLRLVKRITNVFRNGSPLSGLSVNSFVDDPSDANDTATGWPSNFLQGVFQLDPTVSLISGDEVEYTVYYLSDGAVNTKNVRICDPIPVTTSYLSDTFGAGRGISLNRAGQITSLTNIANDDAGAFLGKLAPLPNGHSCPDPSNPNGSMLVNLGDIPNISGQNYGFVRFRVRID